MVTLCRLLTVLDLKEKKELLEKQRTCEEWLSKSEAACDRADAVFGPLLEQKR